jgi:hypothetical protein
MHERALETSEPSCVHRVVKPFFILVIHSPPGVMGHVALPELPSQEDRAPSCGTHCSIRAQQGGEVQGCGPRGGAGAHLSKEARCGAVRHVAVPEPTSARR